MNFVPCSVKHKSCSPAHAAMVRSYRDERARQEQLFEDEFGAYDGDERHAKATGTKLINFKDWLKANKKSAYQMNQEKEHEQDTRICASNKRSNRSSINMEGTIGVVCPGAICASRSWPVGVTRCQRRQGVIPAKAG